MARCISVWINQYIADEAGATAVEYGLIIALIVLAVVGGITLVGGNLSQIFISVAGNL